MGIKTWLQNRIEKDAVKSTLIYNDRDGNDIQEDVLLKRSKIPLIGDWARIYPPLNEDGSWNFANVIFGGKKNLYKLLGVMLILILLFWQVMSLLGESKQYMNPDNVLIPRTTFDKFCSKAISEGGGNFIQVGNITILNISESSGA